MATTYTTTTAPDTGITVTRTDRKVRPMRNEDCRETRQTDKQRARQRKQARAAKQRTVGITAVLVIGALNAGATTPETAQAATYQVHRCQLAGTTGITTSSTGEGSTNLQCTTSSTGTATAAFPTNSTPSSAGRVTFVAPTAPGVTLQGWEARRSTTGMTAGSYARLTVTAGGSAVETLDARLGDRDTDRTITAPAGDLAFTMGYAMDKSGPRAAATARVSVPWAIAVMDDPTSPVLGGTATGPVTRGQTGTLTLPVTDQGSGISRITLTVNGSVVDATVPAGECADQVPETTRGDYRTAAPCPLEQRVTLNTGPLDPGTHTWVAEAQDAAGNTGSLSSGTITVPRPTTPTPTPTPTTPTAPQAPTTATPEEIVTPTGPLVVPATTPQNSGDLALQECASPRLTVWLDQTVQGRNPTGRWVVLTRHGRTTVTLPSKTTSANLRRFRLRGKLTCVRNGRRVGARAGLRVEMKSRRDGVTRIKTGATTRPGGLFTWFNPVTQKTGSAKFVFRHDLAKSAIAASRTIRYRVAQRVTLTRTK